MADFVSYVLGFLTWLPSGVVGLLLTWWTHERFIQKKEGRSEKPAEPGEASRAWKAHPSQFIPSYLLLFIGSSNLLAIAQFIVIVTFNGPALVSYLGALPFAGIGALFTIAGLLVLRERGRTFGAAGGM